MGAPMKIVEITPRKKSPLYSGLVKREADIRKNGRGTFSRKGPVRAGTATWNHKRFKGSVSLKREDAELVTAKVRSRTTEDEGGLLKAFLGFVDRHFGDKVATITIHYR
jgi:hypothetical protein